MDDAVDGPEQMVPRHVAIEREVVEQRALLDLPRPFIYFIPASQDE
jgi:hypothetical protein